MSRTAKQIAAGQRRTLMAIRDKLLCMADEWEGVDEYSRTELTELADQAGDVSVAITPESQP